MIQPIPPTRLEPQSWSVVCTYAWSLYGGTSIVSAVLTLTRSYHRPSFVIPMLLALAFYSFYQSVIAEKLRQAIEHDHEHINLLLALSDGEAQRDKFETYFSLLEKSRKSYIPKLEDRIREIEKQLILEVNM